MINLQEILIVIWLLIGIFDSILIWWLCLEKYGEILLGTVFIMLLALFAGPIGLFPTFVTWGNVTIYKKK